MSLFTAHTVRAFYNGILKHESTFYDKWLANVMQGLLYCLSSKVKKLLNDQMGKPGLNRQNRIYAG